MKVLIYIYIVSSSSSVCESLPLRGKNSSERCKLLLETSSRESHLLQREILLLTVWLSSLRMVLSRVHHLSTNLHPINGSSPATHSSLPASKNIFDIDKLVTITIACPFYQVDNIVLVYGLKREFIHTTLHMVQYIEIIQIKFCACLQIVTFKSRDHLSHAPVRRQLYEREREGKKSTFGHHAHWLH